MKKGNNEGLKSLHLELENFKNIEKKVIDIGGRSLIFLGKNNSGKSTLIQAMLSPMDTKVLPSEPIKKGEERARISHKIGGIMDGEEKEYTLDLYFTPSTNKGRLVVTNEKGDIQKSPATFVKGLIGNVSFDVTKWLNDEKAKKLKTIKELTGCSEKIDIIEMQIDEKKSAMKFKKQRAEELEATLKNHEFAKGEIEKFSEPIDISPIQQELLNISQKQSQWDGIKNQVAGFEKDVESCIDKINKASVEIDRLKQEINRQNTLIQEYTAEADKINSNIQKGKEWMAKFERPSIDEVNSRLSESIVHNEKSSRISSLSNQHKEMITAKVECDNIKIEVDKLLAQRNEIISSSQLPIEGLGFTNDEIYINGLPLEEGQINTATLFKIGVQVAMALNPKLKVIFLHDGSLFDKDGLRDIVSLIEENGYQAVIEMVDYEGGDLEVKFTETELK